MCDGNIMLNIPIAFSQYAKSSSLTQKQGLGQKWPPKGPNRIRESVRET